MGIAAPIILVGTHRSGTSWLTRVFETHPELACWMEPRYVWSWGNNYRRNDVLDQSDATPRVANHIRDRFEKFVRSQGKQRLFEKTPSNCLRLPFIRAVFPDAKIIHLLRDGRSVFNSTNAMLNTGFYRPQKLKDRFHEMLRETPVVEWPAYWPQVHMTIVSKLTRRSIPYWGPRPVGWQDWLEDDPTVLMAKQWAATATKALDDSQGFSSEQYFRCRYEDLIRDPKGVLSELISFAELPRGDQLVDFAAETVFPQSAQHRWSSILDERTLKTIRPYIEPTLEAMGYAW